MAEAGKKPGLGWKVVLAIAVLVAAAALSFGWFGEKIGEKAGGLLSEPVMTIGGPFELVDVDGKPFTDKDLLGKPRAMFFGFTFCPDVCPTTLWEATEWLNALGPDAEKLNFVYVSVDPERDTPEQMKSYLSAFHPQIIGLTGTVEQVQKVVEAYRVYAKKVELDGGDYTMDHTATVYLMDAEGGFRGTIAYGEAEENAVLKLRRLIGVP